MSKKAAEFAQQAVLTKELAVEQITAFWWGLFDNCVKKGFTREESLLLLKTYITAELKDWKNRK